MRDTLLTVWLTSQTNFTPSVRSLLEVCSPEEIYSFSKEKLLELGVSEKAAELLSDKDTSRAERILNVCRHSFTEIIPFYDGRYPKSLFDCPDAPVVVYAKGDISCLNTEALKIGFIGTRDTTVAGREFSTRLAEELLGFDTVLISGGARGTDSYPLIASVEKGNPCAAILGCDINKYYPAEHYSLFECVARCGVVISEYPPETNARFFPSRNRIIAALSDRLVVTEAPSKSGALITAEYAARYGKPVFAPDFEGENFEGCRELIGRGAHRLVSARDIIETVTPTPPFKKAREKIKRSVKRPVENTAAPVCCREFSDPVCQHVFSCIERGLDTVEKMTDASHRPAAVMCALSMLELEGAITALPGGRYKIL